VVLFMASNEYLVSGSNDPAKEELWVGTWKRLDRFLPELQKDLTLDGRLKEDGGLAGGKAPE
jgi:brefeldin A-resistance guanine nucleotide exchange factor 1